ncbi:DgyrCDS9764 [Dimorphilus gyrociliatus]|uniref:Endoplasmic reticulum lectin 1 n=1 Tax=Dimorphilus gyrociliatus TaxID=2664684 RepID=A0A7I8W043_9ANNE|nr:DgyrCDS9764 [Dimorphilus gyrociliatus]
MLGTICTFAIVLTTALSFDPFMDNGMFDMVWLESKNDYKEDPSMSTDSIVLKTRDQEQYKCFLPEADNAQDKDDKVPYKGLSELELLKPLFDTSQCSYRWESYWAYELCHGRFLRQYHEDKEPGKKPKVQEYFLGYYGKNSPDKKAEEIEKAKEKQVDESVEKKLTIAQLKKLLKKKKLDDDHILPYFRVNYTSGTNCDVTNDPRIANILYVCHKNARAELFEIKEVSSCEYEAVVLTELLCSHPAYVTIPKRSQKIRCLPLNNSPTKPKSLAELELRRIKFNSAHVKFENRKDSSIDDEEDLGNDIAQEHLHINSPKEPMAQKQLPDPKSRPKQPRLLPHVREKMIRDIINGESCIDGGSGWWKHEFCLQKQVQQYHEDKNGKKTYIKLGEWNEKYQKLYMQKNQQKRPSSQKESRKSITQYYGNGDVCEETKRHRHVEVKLKCAEKASSAHSISIYILEPRTCEYLLTVESELICSILEKADEDGIIPLQTSSTSPP